MRNYLIKRILLIVPTLIGITMITFVITRFVPGGPVEQALFEAQFNQSLNRSDNNLSSSSREGLNQKNLEYLKELYGFDKPVLEAYWDWLTDIFQLNLGESYRYDEPVLDLIVERLPVSIYYGLITTILTYLICIPLGVLKAIKDKTWIDLTTSLLIFTAYSVPAFVLGLLMLVYLAGKYDLFPLGGFVGDDFENLGFFDQVLDLLYHSVLPLICYMIGSFASMTILMKNSLLENLSSDYIVTAHSKGLNNRTVVFKHALRNSIIPLASSFGNNISLVLAGSFLIEQIFNIDGLGLLGYEAVTQRDYPLVMGNLFIASLLFLVGNILSDVCIAIVDPRIRFK